MNATVHGNFGVVTPQQQAQMEMQIVMAALSRFAQKLAARQHETFIRCLRNPTHPTPQA